MVSVACADEGGGEGRGEGVRRVEVLVLSQRQKKASPMMTRWRLVFNTNHKNHKAEKDPHIQPPTPVPPPLPPHPPVRKTPPQRRGAHP